MLLVYVYIKLKREIHLKSEKLLQNKSQYGKASEYKSYLNDNITENISRRMLVISSIFCNHALYTHHTSKP